MSRRTCGLNSYGSGCEVPTADGTIFVGWNRHTRVVISYRHMANQNLTKLDARDAFLHVVYDYRYLVLSGWAWNSFGPGGPTMDQAAINRQLPGIGVLIQDSLLLHGRNLIEFYSAGGKPTDIKLSDFTTAVPNPSILGSLASYKPAIEAHLMHLTAWRDEPYRQRHGGTTFGSERQRPHWDRDNPLIVQGLIDLLGNIAPKAARWNRPFADLHAATEMVYRDGRAPWPLELTEKSVVLSYLSGFGL